MILSLATNHLHTPQIILCVALATGTPSLASYENSVCKSAIRNSTHKTTGCPSWWTSIPISWILRWLPIISSSFTVDFRESWDSRPPKHQLWIGFLFILHPMYPMISPLWLLFYHIFSVMCVCVSVSKKHTNFSLWPRNTHGCHSPRLCTGYASEGQDGKAKSRQNGVEL